MPHIRKLFESLLITLNVLQLEVHELIISGNKKKLNKAFVGFPCGLINVEEVASVALRLLRINSSTSPKQVRADKRSYDELIQVHLNDLHCISWKIISFLFKNVEMGTEIFERELGALVRDQIKSDLKAIGKPGKGSERALDEFIELVRQSPSFNGQVFVNELISSGIVSEISLKAIQKFSSLLRSGGIKSENSAKNSKKARYHEISESDQKRLENAQKSFCLELEESFMTLSRNFIVFESIYGHLSPQEHVSVTENLINAIIVLFQSQHNFKFVPEIFEAEYLRILLDSLSFALVSFQPAYLPPFLPVSIRILNLIAGKSDASGLSARRALVQVELMIHPRRLGPVTFRPASDVITKVFERSEVEVVTSEVKEIQVTEDFLVVNEAVVEVEIKEAPLGEETNESFLYEKVKEMPIIHNLKVDSKPVSFKNEIEIKEVEKEITKPTITPQTKRSFEQNNKEDDDDLPLPQIVDSGPDDN